MKFKHYLLILFFAVILHFVVQSIYFSKYLDNQVLNNFAPLSVDANGYVEKAANFLKADFKTAFSNLYRMPGYPLFLAIFMFLFPVKSLVAARYVQVLLSSLMLIPAFLIIYRLTGSEKKAILGILPFALWPPFYYFSPILLAETTSMFVLSLLFLTFSFLNKENSIIVALISATLLAISVYLKPNHLILLVLFFVFYFVSLGKELRLRLLIKNYIVFLITLGMLIVPWTIFATVTSNSFTVLSNIKSFVMYVGTGADQRANNDFIHEKISRYYGLDKVKDPEQSAFNVFAKRPFQVIAYDIGKVLHNFGFSLARTRDFVLAFYTIIAIAASIFLWRRNKYRNWCILFWTITSIAVLQTFFFLAEQRFKVVLFDWLGMLMVVLALSEFNKVISRIKKN